jgi:olefin beta-lactone synthetase
MTTIGALLAEQARMRPDAVALIEAGTGRALTFAELDREASAAAREWTAQGIGRGKAVLVFVPLSTSLYIALLGLFRAGGVALFLDPSAGRVHLERCCARRPPDGLLATPKAHLLRLVSAALRQIPRKFVVGGWVPATRRWPRRWEGDVAPYDAARPDDAALVTFTSGSTGVPKAAVRTQAFLMAQYRALAPALELAPGDVDLATLPVFVLANLAAGVTTVLPSTDLRRPGAVDAARIFTDVLGHGVSRIAASPAFFERLVEHGRATGGTLPGLRHLHTGGAPVYPRLLEALGRLAPGARVVAVYGSTEAEPIAELDTDEIGPGDHAAMRAGRGLLAGRPVDALRVRVLRDRWGTARGELTAAALDAESQPPGEAGEIVVAGAHVQTGYLGGVGDEETKFRVGGEVWHRTGDAGTFDEAGRLWLLGRCAARIEDAQGVLYPFGTECVAMTFPEVRRAALVAHGGGRVLVVEAEERPELAEALRQATAGAGVAEVRFIAAMPVDPRHNAKVDYPRLRAWLG